MNTLTSKPAPYCQTFVQILDTDVTRVLHRKATSTHPLAPHENGLGVQADLSMGAQGTNYRVQKLRGVDISPAEEVS